MSDRIQIFGVKLELSSNKPRSNLILLNRMTKIIMPSILVANVVLFAPWNPKATRKEDDLNVRPERSVSLKY